MRPPPTQTRRNLQRAGSRVEPPGLSPGHPPTVERLLVERASQVQSEGAVEADP